MHDPTGLETARSVAANLRGLSRKRPPTHTRRTPGGSGVGGSGAELSGAHPGPRDPAPVGSAVEKLVTDSGWDTDVAVHGVFGRWPTIVGPDVAMHCTP
ncbi:MAG: DciA family protein, partial [Nocardioidaceae bacterium]